MSDTKQRLQRLGIANTGNEKTDRALREVTATLNPVLAALNPLLQNTPLVFMAEYPPADRGHLDANGQPSDFEQVVVRAATATEPAQLAVVPKSSSARGEPGQVCRSTGYVYLCVAKDTWRRVAISTF